MDIASISTWLGILGSIVFVSVLAILWYLRRNDDYWEKQGIPYKPRENIIAGLRMAASKPLHEIMVEEYKKYGRVYGTFEFSSPSIIVADPDLLRDILVKDFHAFPIRRDISIGEKMLDNMVSILKGEDWKRVRTLITPAFTSRRMKQMTHIINQCSKTVVENLEKYAKHKQPVDSKKIFGAFSLDVIANAAFATKIDSLNDADNIFVKHVKKIFEEVSILRLLLFFFLSRRLVVYLKLGALKSLDFLKDITLEVIKQRKRTKQRFDDMLQLLMDAVDDLKTENELLKEEDEVDQYGSITGKTNDTQIKYTKLSEDELIAQCVLFFSVGYETTGSTLSFMAYCLALNQYCQDQLIQEIDQVLLKHNVISYDVIGEMKYLDAVLSETLRLFPAVSRIERTATEDYKLGKQRICIRKGTVVGIPVFPMHHDPELFPEPERFDPTRFMSTEKSNRFQYTYLPFGAGPRNCLGMRFAIMEIKVCITHILRRYRFQLDKSTPVPPKFKLLQGLVSVNELPLLLEERP